MLENSGLTLQWIDWDQRGRLSVVDRDGVLHLSGRQDGPNGGYLELDGQVREIGSDYFILDGTISIIATPDRARRCVESRPNWRFAVTQGRKYWRMRTFEWCDGLTDYIDIYF